MKIRRFIPLVASFLLAFILTGCCNESLHVDLQEKYDKLQEKYENLEKEYESVVKPNPEDISVCLLDSEDKVVDLITTKNFKESVRKKTRYYLGEIHDDIVVSIKSGKKIKEVVIMDSDGFTWKEKTNKIGKDTYVANVEVREFDLYTVMIKNKKNTVYCSFSGDYTADH